MFEVGNVTSYSAIMQDLKIQDLFNAPVREYSERHIKSYGDDIKDMAQLVMCVNHMSWVWYEKDANDPRMEEYADEYYRLRDLVLDSKKFTKEEKSLFLELLD